MPNMNAMKTADAIKHFGTPTQLARALSIKPPSIYCWGELVPKGRAYELQDLTQGALKVDRSLYEQQKAA